MKRLIMYSGGICSWATALRVIERHGIDDVVFLFADTIVEDDDLYRFLIESIADLEDVPVPHCANYVIPSYKEMDRRKAALAVIREEAMEALPHLVWLCDGRTPWEVYNDVRFIGNSQTDPCSKILKRDLLNQWRKQNCDPENTITYFGLDWNEQHRLDRVRKRHVGWTCEAPMLDRPWLHKLDMLALARKRGVNPSTQYSKGVAHDNCGGFCCKAGQAAMALLLKNDRDYYLYNENNENSLRSILGDYSVMKKSDGSHIVDGVRKTKYRNLTMKELRTSLEQGLDYDREDWGGCGCALE